MNGSGTEQERSWDMRAHAYTKRIDKLLLSPEQQLRWSKRLHALLDCRTGLAVLDVGTGPGFLALQLAKLGHRTTGIDISVEMLRIAAAKARALGVDCAFVQGTAETLMFDDCTFDAVVSRHLTGALSERPAVFAEWLRVLKPGGKVIVMDGDWTARNLLPFIRVQQTADTGGSRRRGYRVMGQGKLHGAAPSGGLQAALIMELKEAGFVDIAPCPWNGELPHDSGRGVKASCEQIVIAARRPEA